MASRIAVMSEGRFLQVGAPAEIYETPASRFVADFIGNVNLMDGTLVEDEADHVVVDCGDVPPPRRPRHHRHARHGGDGRAAAREDPAAARRASSPAMPRPASTGRTARSRTSPTSAASPSTTCSWRAAASSRSARATSSASRERAADLGRRGLGELDRPVAGGADAMRSRRSRRRARRRAAARASACPTRGCCVFFLLPFLVVAEDQRLRDGDDDVKDIVTWKDGAIAFSAQASATTCCSSRTTCTCAPTLSSLLYAAVTTAALPGDRLPVRLLHGARARAAAAGAADAGDAAVLDLVPAARLRLEGAARPSTGWSADAIERARPRPRCSPPPASSRRRAS